MKFLLTFFIFICFHLLDEQSSVYTSSVYHAAKIHPGKIKAVERTGEGKHSLVSDQPGTPGENDLPLFVEDEDDENDSRKCKSTTESFSTFYSAFTASYTSADLPSRLSIRKLPLCLSYRKFIAQRVIRI